MFTGIIQTLGTITAIESNDSGDCSFFFDCNELYGQTINLGDSIAVNGCCLTVVEQQDKILKVDVSSESLSRTVMGQYRLGTQLNLELAMQPQSRFGGHIVTGHVDGLGKIEAIKPDARSLQFDISVTHHRGFVAEKGSVTVDGVSLTVNSVIDQGEETIFSVNIIPHTFENTIFKQYTCGSLVHIEIDLIARYLHRLNQVG